MRLTRAEIIETRMPLRAPFETSFGTQVERDALPERRGRRKTSSLRDVIA